MNNSILESNVRHEVEMFNDKINAWRQHTNLFTYDDLKCCDQQISIKENDGLIEVSLNTKFESGSNPLLLLPNWLSIAKQPVNFYWDYIANYPVQLRFKKEFSEESEYRIQFDVDYQIELPTDKYPNYQTDVDYLVSAEVTEENFNEFKDILFLVSTIVTSTTPHLGLDKSPIHATNFNYLESQLYNEDMPEEGFYCAEFDRDIDYVSPEIFFNLFKQVGGEYQKGFTIYKDAMTISDVSSIVLNS